MMYFFEDRYNEIWYLNIRETIYDSRNEVEENWDNILFPPLPLPSHSPPTLWNFN